MKRLKFSIFMILPALLLFAPGCDKSEGYAPASPERTTAAAAPSPQKHFKQETASLIVDQCEETFRYLYGEGGCLPDRMSPERIEASCAGYAAWEQRSDFCITQSFDTFFTCLRQVECDVFDREEEGDEEDGEGLGGYFSACRRQFAKDMDICAKAQEAQSD